MVKENGAASTTASIHILDVPSSHTPSPSELSSEYTHPSIYKGHFSKVLIPHSQIQSRTKDLASLIHSHYPTSEPLVLLCILKGSGPFFHSLASALTILKHPYVTEFTRISSYVGASTQSSGEDITVAKVLEGRDLRGRHVLVVEDIVDTGNTLSKFLPIVKENGLASCEVCTLLTKRLESNGAESRGVVPKFSGFSVPDEFVVGYGLDYNEMYRDLEDIWIMSKKGIEFGGMDGFKKD